MPQLHELNIRTWRTERSRELGRPATLDDLPFATFDRLVEHGFTWLYLLGVWTAGDDNRAIALADQHLRAYLAAVLPGFSDADITGSPMAPSDYRVADELGGDAALERLRARARASGLSLMLDYVPNHVGPCHAWVRDHPDYFVRGGADDLRQRPEAYIRIDDHIFAHGRDPFFPPWRQTVQLDYANPATQEAMIRTASAVAARCDGLRCDEAQLLVPDVFESTWRRRMAPFWRRCLDTVRAEHPGTLFMAEVYWNREYELQQAGFDFTYDKILYDRLLSGDAESIRAHLRATADFQAHCVRFLENHTEQRAAARFTNPDHHRGALFIAGMTPGMLLCHDGQQDGRVLHCSLNTLRRPPEDGSAPHRDAYRQLMELLGEPARAHGSWTLLEPRGDRGNPLVAMLWTLAAQPALLVIVNAGWHSCRAAVDAGPLANRDCLLHDHASGGAPAAVKSETLRAQGIEVDLGPWGAVALRVTQPK